jgi:hyaluronan synthase
MDTPIILKASNIEVKLKEYLFNIFLLTIGIIGLYFIVLIKSKTYIDNSVTSPLFLFTIFTTTFQLSRLTGAIFYNHSKKMVKDGYLRLKGVIYEPTVSIVIPCKNEQDAIEKTIRKCFAAEYPKEKIEVIVINDGSTDNTIGVLRKLGLEFPNLVIIDWHENQGKRQGMAAGIKIAKGEIILQLDSDSYIDPSTFKYIIEPFKNPEIGAVCAHADPENADTNLLTKMQAAYYFMSFRILKAAESTFATVFCCSGCSSAYRKGIIKPIMDDWLGEKFLGLPVTWGDDRALTNWVLKLGYKTIYTDDTQAYTICPDSFKKFLKQQVRWKKGWFVNSLNVAKFIYKKDLFVSITYFYPLVLVTLLTPFIALRALVYNPLVKGVMPWYYIMGVFLVSVVITTYYRYIARNNKYWPYLFVWSGINMIFLSFVLFYALATIQNRKWGTR